MRNKKEIRDVEEQYTYFAECLVFSLGLVQILWMLLDCHKKKVSKSEQNMATLLRQLLTTQFNAYA